ncbi:MAG TPA: hypothetical protein VF269_04615 [Rhodanobacteraceae bacterium]
MFRVLWPWLLLVLAGLLAAWLRHGLIEVPALAGMCGAASAPWWCVVRHAVIQGFLHDGYGVAALLLVALAWWRRSRALALLAAALGAWALVLYNVEPGAVALLAGCLRLVYLQGQPAVSKRA